MLIGNGLMWRKRGRCLFALLHVGDSNASLASVSACSLPFILLCSHIQQSFMLACVRVFSLRNLLIVLRNLSIR